MDKYYDYIKSPIGLVEIITDFEAVVQINLNVETFKANAQSNHISKNAKQQLAQYFSGERKRFNLKLKPKGTEFQLRVWNCLQTINYSKTISYQTLATMLNDVKIIRAAASANGKNPIPIIIPCHRVIGKNGALTGYSGGLANKRTLLELEGAIQKSMF